MAITQREAILVTALELQAEFTMGDLVDGLWARYPDLFRLKGYDLPNSGYVESKIYGSTGVVDRGLFEQLRGTKVFRLTKAGRAAAKRVGEPKAAVTTPVRERTPVSKPTPVVEKPRVFDPPIKRPLWGNHF